METPKEAPQPKIASTAGVKSNKVHSTERRTAAVAVQLEYILGFFLFMVVYKDMSVCVCVWK